LHDEKFSYFTFSFKRFVEWLFEEKKSDKSLGTYLSTNA
jgi:hypothetical protein